MLLLFIQYEANNKNFVTVSFFVDFSLHNSTKDSFQSIQIFHDLNKWKAAARSTAPQKVIEIMENEKK